MTTKIKAGFHTYADRRALELIKRNLQGTGATTTYVTQHFTDLDRSLSYRFMPHFHPWVTELVKRLVEGSVDDLQAADTDYVAGATINDENGQPEPKPTLYADIFTSTAYAPTAAVQAPLPIKELDFSTGGAYSVYNWELFYHIPLAIALQLGQNQRYEDAQKWFQYIFDPTDDSDGPTPERFWKVRPLQKKDFAKIEEILLNLSADIDPDLYAQTIACITAWSKAPFRPHLIARYRQTPYMYKAVMAYLDNLIAWGDSLFREDTGESINEATQLYVIAANILGTRPQEIPAKGTVGVQTYAKLRGQLDPFSNALQNLESELPFELAQIRAIQSPPIR